MTANQMAGRPGLPSGAELSVVVADLFARILIALPADTLAGWPADIPGSGSVTLAASWPRLFRKDRE